MEQWSIVSTGKAGPPLMYAAYCTMGEILRVQASIRILLENGADPVAVNEDGFSPLLIRERLSSTRTYPTEEDRAIQEEIKSLLRRHGAEETKSPTSADILSKVVAQLTVTLIEIVTSAVSIEPTDHQIALESSAQLFRGLNLYPTVPSNQLQDNMTVEQKITEFVQAQVEQYEKDTADSEKSLKEDPSPVPKSSEVSQSDVPNSILHEPGMPKSLAAEASNQDGGLKPSQESKPRSDFLQRLAKLQQRLFNVNRCLYYLESNPDDCPETIDDLITKMIGQESREFDDDNRRRSEPENDSSCEVVGVGS